jgi:hypothetical protein
LTFWRHWCTKGAIQAKFPTLTIIQHWITMWDRRTSSRLTLLTILFFETKSTLYCYQLPFSAYNSSNTVHPSFGTALVCPVNPVLI